jgi:hypothetical protein
VGNNWGITTLAAKEIGRNGKEEYLSVTTTAHPIPHVNLGGKRMSVTAVETIEVVTLC